MNVDHAYAMFSSNPEKFPARSTCHETETYKKPYMTDSPVSSGKIFPDGYGCETEGRFDHDKPNNNIENTESECIATNPEISSGHPASLEIEIHKKPDLGKIFS